MTAFTACCLHVGRPLVLAAVFLAASSLSAAAEAPALTGQSVNDADFAKTVETTTGVTVESRTVDRALVAKLQVLLDRKGFSVGVIDGFQGENVAKAIWALEFAEGLEPDGLLDDDVWAALAAEAIEPALVDYEITEQDVAGPFLDRVPEDFRELATLKSVAYTGPLEMLAERFHMDEDLLAELNPGKNFALPGTVVVVADPGTPIEEPQVETLEVDGRAGTVSAYDAEGLLVAFYPATVGSKESPGPRGRHQVRTVAVDPAYTYDPDVNFAQDGVTERLHIPPGPNGPVGTVWIDLTEPTYGIHGTAEPAEVDKNWSHGCVRLTNWDAHELAHLVREGTVVEFLDTGEPPAKGDAPPAEALSEKAAGEAASQ